MKFKTITLLAVLLTFGSNAFSQQFQFKKGERLSYNIYYQWGFIWKKAAEATLSSQETTYQTNKALQLRLAARTTSFFDNFLRVRDTLVALTSTDLQPKYYAKITHEGSYHGKDDLHYTYKDGKISTRSRTYRDMQLRSDTSFVHDKTQIFDMLSLFYNIRTLDIPSLKVNQIVPMTIISGDKLYNIKVIYKGETEMETPDDKKYQTYKLVLILETPKGKKIQKEEMNFWMSKDTSRLPMQLSAKLPLGSLKAFFKGIE
ncbi:MAG: DUF3108 domain-containing protein [Bacteroidales bacterium]